MCRGHIDAATGGAFLSLTIDKATVLINKMVTNQSWGEERKTQKATHTVKETDMLAAKIDLLMRRLDDCAQEKEPMTSTINTIDSRMTCEVYENVGHSGNDCPKPEMT